MKLPPEIRVKLSQEAFAEGNLDLADEFLRAVPPGSRPKDFEVKVAYCLAKEAAVAHRWGECEAQLKRAAALTGDPLYQQRLSLLRRRNPLMEDTQWEHALATIDVATRLNEDSLRPSISKVWACGAYYSRGSLRGNPWSSLLRRIKMLEASDLQLLERAAAFFSRFAVERTELLRLVDVVVAIPANPQRYANRRNMSVPDELAKRIEVDLALPFLFDALVCTDPNLELRGLDWSERRWRIRGSMRGDKMGLGASRSVLVVDDVTTSGATLMEAGRQLRAIGAGDVFALTLCHTEG